MARTASEHGPHPVDRHVGRRLAERRISLGYNQSDLGRAIGTTFQQVQKYEKGTNRISASRLFEAAAFLSVPVGWFFEGLGDAPDGTGGQGSVQAQTFPVTRNSIEIDRLAPRLPAARQKLVLDLMKDMAKGSAGDSRSV